MGSKSINEPKLNQEDLINRDWVIGDRVYRFYPSGVLIVKSPGKQASFNYEIEFKHRYYLVIDNVYYEAAIYPTVDPQLHLRKKQALAKTKVLVHYTKQVLLMDPMDDIF